MNVRGAHRRTIWVEANGWSVGIIDQVKLPHEFSMVSLRTVTEMADAIERMRVRGAPLIGAAAAYGLALAVREDPSDEHIARSAERLLQTRPTAVNLQWAITRMTRHLASVELSRREIEAYRMAAQICDDDVEINRNIGVHGLILIRQIADRNPHRPVQVMTHCNAGWLATVDWGTALAP